jgi:hypothetical protein
MKAQFPIGPTLIATVAVFLLVSCFGDSNPVEDAQKTAAIRKVEVSVDSGAVEPQLPDGAQSGGSFDSLAGENPATYTDPGNYGVDLAYYFLVDNTAKEAEDAKFDGITADIVFDTYSDSPVKAESGPFEVAKGEVRKVPLTTSMNIATHRLPCLYVFQQIVDGADVKTTVSPNLNYKIGSTQGVIEIPDIVVNIPTRASEETKVFLSDMLQSGLFEE